MLMNIINNFAVPIIQIAELLAYYSKIIEYFAQAWPTWDEPSLHCNQACMYSYIHITGVRDVCLLDGEARKNLLEIKI